MEKQLDLLVQHALRMQFQRLGKVHSDSCHNIIPSSQSRGKQSEIIPFVSLFKSNRPPGRSPYTSSRNHPKSSLLGKTHPGPEFSI